MVRRRRLTPIEEVRIAMSIEAKAKGLTLREFEERLIGRRRKKR